MIRIILLVLVLVVVSLIIGKQALILLEKLAKSLSNLIPRVDSLSESRERHNFEISELQKGLRDARKDISRINDLMDNNLVGKPIFSSNESWLSPLVMDESGSLRNLCGRGWIRMADIVKNQNGDLYADPLAQVIRGVPSNKDRCACVEVSEDGDAKCISLGKHSNTIQENQKLGDWIKLE